MTGAAVPGLLAAIDANAAGLTLCRIGAEVRLIGPGFEGVAAFVVLEGTLRLEREGLPTVEAPAGSVVIDACGKPPALSFGGSTPRRTLPAVTRLSRSDGWLIADATLGGRQRLTVLAARIAGTTKTRLDDALVVPVDALPRGGHAFAALAAEARSTLPGSSAMAQALMSACVVLALRQATSGSAAALVPPERGSHELSIARAVAEILARPSAAHSVASLAQVAGMSRATFLRHFRSIKDEAPMEFVLRTRLREAASMLRSTKLPVKDVATATGFANRSHFSRSFRSAFGQDPRAYRSWLPPVGDLERAPTAQEGSHEDQSIVIEIAPDDGDRTN